VGKKQKGHLQGSRDLPMEGQRKGCRELTVRSCRCAIKSGLLGKNWKRKLRGRGRPLPLKDKEKNSLSKQKKSSGCDYVFRLESGSPREANLGDHPT